jgi:tetratricopeptide (TPR) repeat protein
MPGIGILGATFGYVVAMDSPSSRPTAHFQWGTTLWHEMAHVFTLEATGHLVPRWFSEGVSVFEEWRSGPNAGVRIPMSVYNAMKDDRFLPIAELDEGFIRPTYDEQVIVSYMQAGLICHFIDQRFGAEKLRQLLNAFGDGLLTAAAIPVVFDMTPADFDNEFNLYISREHGMIVDNLDDWQRTYQSVSERAAEEDWDSIIDLAEHLITLWPGYVEPDSPYVALARSHDALGDRDAAIASLDAFWKNGGYDPAALKQLSRWHVEAGQTSTAIEVLQTVNMVDPLDLEHHGELGDLLISADRPAEALLEYTVALALNPHDKATAYYRLARAHNALGDRDASQSQLLLALDVAPNFRPAQRLLLDLMRAENGIEQQ